MSNEDIIKVIYVEGEDKPWQLDFKDVSVLKTARAAVNYPITKFETENDAIEVATMLRDIIHAKEVEVIDQDGEEEVLDDVQKAPFFNVVHRDEEEENVEKASEVVASLDDKEIRANQEREGLALDTDQPVVNPGPSQKQTEAELGYDEPHPRADYK